MISSTTYKSYSDNIADTLSRLDGVQTELFAADDKYSGIGSVVTTSKSRTALDYSAVVNSLVNLLQDHVERNSGLDVDDWLTSVSVKVKQRFATESNALGYTISSGNIE